MSLLIRQRVFSWSDTYDVYDENQQPRYFIKTEYFTLGHRIHIYDLSMSELAYIEQKILVFRPTFDLYVHGGYLGQIARRFFSFSDSYDIDVGDLSVEGDLFGWDYDILRSSSRIGAIEHKILSWGDTYVLEYANPSDELALLTLVIAIDAAHCSR